MIDVPKLTATINTEEVETVELPPIVATIETKENFVEVPKIVTDIRPEKPIVGNLGTMVAGKGKDGVDGLPGKDGIDGKDGYTPIKGVDYFDGLPGVDGRPGADGYTPQRGKDYWTPADIQAMVADAVNGVLAQKSTILERAYPVGAIYMSTASTNPKNLFGFGTWEQVKDTFLLAAGNTYAAGSTGGEATHKLTIDEMPNHRHQLRCGSTDGTDLWVLTDVKVTKNQYSEFRSLDYIQHTGGDQPHNNMPPYLAVYVWKRTA